MYSPERRLTTSLTPRVAPHDTPGSLLSQPARRPKSYRQRVISYSFDESERASAAYEDVQESDDDSNNSTPAPEESRSLHEELYGGSPQGTSIRGDLPSSPPAFAENLRCASEAGHVSEEIRIFCVSSPQLSLPPPFSAVPRNFSLQTSIPSALGQGSPSRSPSASPPRSGVRGLQGSPVYQSGISPDADQASPAVGAVLYLLKLVYTNNKVV